MTLLKIDLRVLSCLTLLLLLITSTVKSDTLTVDYKTFYSHLSKLNSEETNALQFAFGFMNIQTKQLCEISKARISTDKKQIPLNLTSEHRFTLPTEKALRLANAVVIIELTEKSNICDISVQLETKPEYVKAHYTHAELTLIFEQYSSFFDGVGSFMSFMMPTVDGLSIQFVNKSLNVSLPNNMQVKNGVLTINESEIKALDDISLPTIPLRITAKTSK